MNPNTPEFMASKSAEFAQQIANPNISVSNIPDTDSETTESWIFQSEAMAASGNEMVRVPGNSAELMSTPVAGTKRSL